MDEPNVALRWAMYHFAGGDAYLCGLVAFVVCQSALRSVRGPKVRWWLITGSRFGLVWAIADPPPVELGLVVLFLVIVVTGWILQWRNRAPADSADPGIPRHERIVRFCLSCVAAIGIVSELPHYWYRDSGSLIKSLCVVGDSITAGLKDGEDTWPKRLSRQAAVSVRDASQPGATLQSARRQVELLDPGSRDSLILEIGGNDLLEGLPIGEFERNLDQLLQECRKPGLNIIMFELPLPPLAMRYGEIQRQLAHRYDVRLIPRRNFLQVLTAAGSTVDGIHLSAAGQERMAFLVQKLHKFPAADQASKVDYRHFEPPRKSAGSR